MVVIPMLAIASMRNTTSQFAGLAINPQLIQRSGISTALRLLKDLCYKPKQYIAKRGHKNDRQPVLESPTEKDAIH